MLLTSAFRRLLVASVSAAAIWASVVLVAPDAPLLAPQGAAVSTAAATRREAAPQAGPLSAMARSGQPAPGGGVFDRFFVPGQVAAAPVNAAGQVVFYATIQHSAGREGLFLADAAGVAKIVAAGDAAPGGGIFAGFSERTLPTINGSGQTAFVAEITGGRSTGGVFLAGAEGVRAVALAGEAAPGVPLGMLIDFHQPAINDNAEIAVVATVRAGAETIDVLYLWNGRRLQKVVAERDLLPRIGGTMAAIGEPAINNSGVIAFPATLQKGPALGGIFVAGARTLALVVRAGDTTPRGLMIQRFSERVALDDADGIAFGAFVGDSGSYRGAVLRADPGSLSEVAVEGEPAPQGGRYAGFSPWPTAGSDGSIAFIAALDGADGPLALFSGRAGGLKRAVLVGEPLPSGGRMGQFPLNAIASIAKGERLSFLSMAPDSGRATLYSGRSPSAP